MEKFWKAVKADQEDFNAWTYLLQYVDSENDVEAAREAYDRKRQRFNRHIFGCFITFILGFLSRYCYCYGYWRKYADYEKKKGSIEKCDEVSEITFDFHLFTLVFYIITPCVIRASCKKISFYDCITNYKFQKREPII